MLCVICYERNIQGGAQLSSGGLVFRVTPMEQIEMQKLSRRCYGK